MLHAQPKKKPKKKTQKLYIIFHIFNHFIHSLKFHSNGIFSSFQFTNLLALIFIIHLVSKSEFDLRHMFFEVHFEQKNNWILLKIEIWINFLFFLVFGRFFRQFSNGFCMYFDKNCHRAIWWLMIIGRIWFLSHFERFFFQSQFFELQSNGIYA